MYCAMDFGFWILEWSVMCCAMNAEMACHVLCYGFLNGLSCIVLSILEWCHVLCYGSWNGLSCVVLCILELSVM